MSDESLAPVPYVFDVRFPWDEQECVRAERAVAELEQRLAKLQAPLEERLQAYEQRIAELEQELTAQGEEKRELIQAQIDLTRKKLAAEQGQDQVTWN